MEGQAAFRRLVPNDRSQWDIGRIHRLCVVVLRLVIVLREVAGPEPAPASEAGAGSRRAVDQWCLVTFGSS
jgi:hypothetical protein